MREKAKWGKPREARRKREEREIKERAGGVDLGKAVNPSFESAHPPTNPPAISFHAVINGDALIFSQVCRGPLPTFCASDDVVIDG